jgi:hypothetical protein
MGTYARSRTKSVQDLAPFAIANERIRLEFRIRTNRWTELPDKSEDPVAGKAMSYVSGGFGFLTGSFLGSGGGLSAYWWIRFIVSSSHPINAGPGTSMPYNCRTRTFRRFRNKLSH